MENKKTKVDIILPNFNSSNYIRETLNSVINQTYSSWNLIIVDDCSDKKTVNIFLRCDDPIIKKSLDLNNSPEDEVFSRLRDLKDNF